MIAGGQETPDEQFRRMFQLYYRPLVGYLMKSFRRLSLDDARDIAQDAFLRVFKSMDTPIRNERALLHITARRLALNAVTRDLRSDVGIETVSGLADPASGPEANLEHQEQVERLAQAIEELPEGTRICLLHRLSGLRYREIADLLNITLDSVKSRLHYALTELKQRLGNVTDRIDLTGDEDDR
jgi:RNA polymerase sigma-70 factor (ECF subfamily)